MLHNMAHVEGSIIGARRWERGTNRGGREMDTKRQRERHTDRHRGTEREEAGSGILPSKEGKALGK